MTFDPRRMFHRAEVRRAWERQGRLCGLCKRSIPFDLMHGDHIVPWIGGGATDMANLQALCGSCNLRKGSQPQDVVAKYFEVDAVAPGSGELRRWQVEALPIVLEKIQTEPAKWQLLYHQKYCTWYEPGKVALGVKSAWKC